MTSDIIEIQRLVAEMATLIERDDDPDPQLYAPFFQQPEFAFQLIDFINALEENNLAEDPPIYSACIFALDICVAQLQSSTEAGNKAAGKTLTRLMNQLSKVINTHEHSLGFWLPVLNAFYEVHVELSQDLKEAYFDLANRDDDVIELGEPISHVEAIRALINDLSDLSIFDIAENFFAQSYAMPADFFIDLVEDLCSIDEGQDIALLTLLHPKAEVREVVMATLGQIISTLTLSSQSLSRLQAIKLLYPQIHHAVFDHWIRLQRKKGVVFAPEVQPTMAHIQATEVDGTGSQGLFIRVGKNKKNRLCGLLLKYNYGIKDAWITPVIPLKEVAEYYRQAFEESVTLRDVDIEYLQMMVEHYLAIIVENNSMPNLHFLEIQELLGLRFKPKKLDVEELFEQLSVEISPFTQENTESSLKRSKSWLKTKHFTESWYIENPYIDKIVNHNSSFVDGVKVCRLDDAMTAVFTEELERNRQQWQFHFLWMALWAKAKQKKNEKLWQDCFLIAYTIHQGMALKDIPVMKEICHQTVINSVETMQDRKTHLSKE